MHWFKYKNALLYGLSLALLLLLLQWLEFRFLVLSHSMEVYVGFIALLFTGLGVWLALKLAKPKKETIVIEKEVHIPAPTEFTLNQNELERLGISKRELEVLQLMSEGLSNAEIAERLFVSLNTIKTHSSKLFEKLDVKRRTQAVEAAKRLQLIP
ncbi:LuxR family transcriptional regulator [Flavobacterium akiainvivens]|uniref:LuxR family transcriptional regulator n=1 Tax=Flavobacterium akiainvivens TaxID=1202724 RepID=A0A0M9VGQ6_9FLAO|nr:response regulator transcription factor [Flavobacterium akiainvivens]KOS04742.1 LuxR family transcriptional regulator [Flavobacterium akiainvivens]SFQ66802.1 transcriptional regulator, LuxR family [Flavobacterium akiainvivens]